MWDDLCFYRRRHLVHPFKNPSCKTNYSKNKSRYRLAPTSPHWQEPNDTDYFLSGFRRLKPCCGV
jgi:hypothetical protein